MLLSPPLIGRHVQMGERHLEDGIGDPILMVLRGNYKHFNLGRISLSKGKSLEGIASLSKVIM